MMTAPPKMSIRRLRHHWIELTMGIVMLGSIACIVMLIGLFVLPRDSATGKRFWDLATTARYYLIVDPPWKGPNIEWASASPQSVGLDAVSLQELSDALGKRDTHALLLVKDNRIVHEWYGSGGPNLRRSVASMAKALVGSLALAAALDSGAIELDDAAARYIPEWENDPLRSRITLIDLATHSAGIEDVYFGNGTEPDTGWQGQYYQNPDQRFRMAITAAPVGFHPGTRYSYSGVGYYALAYALTEALQRAGLADIRKLLNDRVMEPIGVPESDWSISYGDSYSVDGMQLYAIGSGGSYTARAVARIGQLMLDEGSWAGTELLSAESVRSITSYHGTPVPERTSGEPEPAPALGWWVNSDGVWTSVPTDAFVGVGANHQILLVIPSLDLVAVRLGGSLGETHWGDGFWHELEDHFLKPLMKAVEAS